MMIQFDPCNFTDEEAVFLLNTILGIKKPNVSIAKASCWAFLGDFELDDSNENRRTIKTTFFLLEEDLPKEVQDGKSEV